MKFLEMYWPLILVAAFLIAGVAAWVVKFSRKSAGEKEALIREWLLQAVILIEKEYGSGTGKLKLSVAYDRFCERFPWMVKIVSFELFSRLVDEALEEMKHIITTNAAIADLVHEQTDDAAPFVTGFGVIDADTSEK